MQTISKETFTFLRGLAKHNNRTWFAAHKDEYKRVHAEFSAFSNALAAEIATFDSGVKKALKKHKTIKIFRIYRDVRFARDKVPYKINFAVAVSPGGMEAGNPGYYLHVQPGGGSSIGGGMHWVTPPQLKRLRDAIDRNAAPLHRIIDAKAFHAVYANGLADYNALKTVPRGYEKDHPDIDLLRLKSFTAFTNFTDAEVTSAAFFKKALKTMRALKPLNDYLDKVLNGR